ncbi:hypothetical protein [Tissierella sp.]|uniref:hypothetical protein n=1 Tax=Tissierella sp. TaxID=41274 RepID=UPI0030605025
MESISKSVGWIKDFKKVEKEQTLDDMIKNLNESAKKFQEENKIYHDKMQKQLDEIKALTKYTLSEQEELKIASMTTTELLIEMQKNMNEMKIIIEKFEVR